MAIGDGAKLRHLTIMPDHRRALCPVRRGVTPGIRALCPVSLHDTVLKTVSCSVGPYNTYMLIGLAVGGMVGFGSRVDPGRRAGAVGVYER